MKSKLLLWVVPVLAITGCSLYFLFKKKHELTDAERIVEKYINYSGGEEAFDLIENCIMETFIGFDNADIYSGKYWYVDKKFRKCVRSYHDTISIQLSDTKKTYQYTPIYGDDGISKIDEKSLPLFNKELNIERNNPLIRLGRYRRNNAKVYWESANTDGTVIIRLTEDSLSQYFSIDSTTGKPKSTLSKSISEIPGTTIISETIFNSFKKTKDGYYYPSYWECNINEIVNGLQTERRAKIINRVGYNVQIDKSVFEFPNINEKNIPVVAGKPY